jgi:hypothetical protein
MVRINGRVRISNGDFRLILLRHDIKFIINLY